MRARRCETQNASQQFDRIADSAQNRATAVEEAAAAGKALYAMLAAEQKALADVRLANVLSTVLGSGAGQPPARNQNQR